MDLEKGHTRLIIDTCKKHGLLRNQCAYVLATTYHETAHTMQPIRERGGEKYLRSKKYYPYVGMGFVQLTWKRNYERASRELGVDFVANPRKLLEPGHAAHILVVGMKEGWFTGKKLSDYVTLAKSRFVDARRIINGTDRAKDIATIAAEYNRLLVKEGYGVEKPPLNPAEPVSPVPPSRPVQKPETAPQGKSGGLWATIAALLAKLFGRKGG